VGGIVSMGGGLGGLYVNFASPLLYRLFSVYFQTKEEGAKQENRHNRRRKQRKE
jgi:hypothetical protein